MSALDRVLGTSFIRRVGAGVVADRLIFATLIAIIIAKALTVADITWDTYSYYMPFAARRVGLITAADYQFSDWLEACYRGFPPLPYYIYGALWRFTDNVNTANVVSGVFFAVYCVIIGRTFKLPLTLIAVATAAIPVIQVNIASVYTDLVANLSFAAALVLASTVLLEPDRPVLPRTGLAIALTALAANWKLTFMPVGIAFLAMLFVGLWLVKSHDRSLLRGLREEIAQSSQWSAVALGLLILLCLAPAIRNQMLNQNPIYPMGLTVAGIPLLHGFDAGLIYKDPVYLRGEPQFVRWILSVSEYLALGGRRFPYMIGQGNVPKDSEGLRMGGYLAFFVVYNFIVFAAFAIKRRGPYLLLLAGFLLGTVFIACMPASHELRYFSFWIVYLVTMNMVMIWTLGGTASDRLHFTAASVGAFFFVCTINAFTSFGGLSTDRIRLPQIFAAFKLDQTFVPMLREGGRYCLVNWGPYPMLGSPAWVKSPHFQVTVPGENPCPSDYEVIDFTSLGHSEAPR